MQDVLMQNVLKLFDLCDDRGGGKGDGGSCVWKGDGGGGVKKKCILGVGKGGGRGHGVLSCSFSIVCLGCGGGGVGSVVWRLWW